MIFKFDKLDDVWSLWDFFRTQNFTGILTGEWQGGLKWEIYEEQLKILLTR